ncbi:MAG: hypothetical protein CMJ78_00215 [Planctomycetaceae bacterium]|nr:hypothetical protein [Planctomycetaceae bacterium]
MQLGNFKLTTISGGRFLLDGGTMFGVVPKIMWARLIPPDDQNRICQDTKCLFIDTGKHKVLVDTGYGSKLAEKQRRVFDIAEGDVLLDNLTEAGIDAADIDTVILTHLHFDHAGGATRCVDEGQIVCSFPNATYYVQRREWIEANSSAPELRGAYAQENFAAIEAAGQLQLIDGNVEIVAGIRSWVTGGHTLGHQALVIESEDAGAIYLGDLCPTSRHLPRLWGMSYDLDVLQIRRCKPEVLGTIADRDWWALFDHDPDFAGAKLTREEKREFAVAETLESL